MSARNDDGAYAGALGGGVGGAHGGFAVDHFAPALVETSERAPSGLMLWLPSVVGVMVLVLGAWAGMARLDIVASATGRLMPVERAKLVEVAPLVAERVTAREYLVERGLAARAEFLELRQRQIEIAHDLEVLERNLARDDADLALAAERRHTLVVERREGLLTRLGEVEPQVAELEGELRKVGRRAERRTLLAPADGVITELAVHTIGGIVREAETLMRIVPERERLEVEAVFANRDVGFVRPGQSVAVKVDSFPYTRYGKIIGTVLTIAADATGAESPAGQTAPLASGASPVGGYRARIALERETMTVDGHETRLVAGMTVTVDVRTGERSVLDYLMAPLTRLQAEALHER